MEQGLRPMSACPPKSAMEITQQIRDEAAKQGITAEEAAAVGMTEKSEEFREAGGEIYS